MKILNKTISFVVMALVMSCGAAMAQVEWRTIEEAAKVDTKGNQKFFFVDFYTSWCGWCKKMDRDTFTDPTVAKLLNKYFIPVKFNAEGNSEFAWNGTPYANPAGAAQGGHPATHPFARAVLGAKIGFPSFGVFDASRNRVTILQGYMSASEFAITLWYIASGDYKNYEFEQYKTHFDEKFRGNMNKALGIN